MVRLANGQMVPAAQMSKYPTKPRKLLICLQYWAGDKDTCEELAGMIADLERVKNHDADILFFGRSDAGAPSHDIISKMSGKFDKVMHEKCRRAAPNPGNCHPYACNQLFYDMVTLFSQVKPWINDYYAFINLETDCVPTRPGWIHELIAAWRLADSQGKACIGFIHDDVKRHMNGVGVYAIDMWARVGSNKLAGGSPQVPYDIRHADSILPLAVDSPLFYFEYRRATITPDDLFAERRDGIAPAIWHGVKDGSARAAVKARHITFTEQRELSRTTVLTFYEPSDYTSQTESAALLEVWRDGWKSRGWNPVVLSSRDAIKHARFREIMAHVQLLPHIGHDSAHANRFMRWLALARLGGGLMVDYDLIPANFTPHDLPDGSAAIIDAESAQLCGLRLSREDAARWLDAILRYVARQEDAGNVTDLTVFQNAIELAEVENIEARAYGIADGWAEARLVHFSESAVNKMKPGTRKSVAVDGYLRAKV